MRVQSTLEEVREIVEALTDLYSVPPAVDDDPIVYAKRLLDVHALAVGILRQYHVDVWDQMWWTR